MYISLVPGDFIFLLWRNPLMLRINLGEGCSCTGNLAVTMVTVVN